MKHAALALLATLAAACAAPQDHPTLQASTIGNTRNVHVFGDVYLAGQPTPEDFAIAEEAGIRTVINSRREVELDGFDEEALVTELGMRYIALPWNGPDELTDDVFDRSRELLETAERPILFHCASANRIGAVWIPWRVLDGGVPYEEALVEAKLIGLRTDAYEAKAADYVARRR